VRIKKLFFLSLILFFIISLVLISSEKKKLTYQQVFLNKGEKLFKSMPGIIKWLNDEYYLQREKPEDKKQKKETLYKVNALTGEKSEYKKKQEFNNLPSDFNINHYTDKSKDGDKLVFNRKNDLYIFIKSKDLFRQITDNPCSEKTPKFSPNGEFIAYTRNHNLYITELQNGLEHQITTDGSNTILNGYASWVYYEEIIGRSSRYKAFWWSPDSSRIVFLRFDNSNVPVFPLFRSTGIHGELEKTAYPQPGDSNPKVKLGIVEVKNGKIIWADTEPDKDNYIAWPLWSQDGKQLFFQQLNRNQNHLVLFKANLTNGKKEKIYEEKQDSWVDFFKQNTYYGNDIYFMKDGRSFLLISNKSGWSHLYLYSINGKLIKQLTKGDWKASRIKKVDEANKTIYFTGFKEKSTDNHLFKIDFNGKNLKKLTLDPGSHSCILSPNNKYFIDTYSNIKTPRKIKLFSTKGEFIREIADSKTKLMDDYSLGKTELFTIPSGDGYNLPAIWILPPDFDKTKKYPIIIRIYGGPNSATVRNSFQRLSNFYFAQNKIIVMSVDHRGSGHFGKNGVSLMHRNLGKWEMHDYIAAVKWLKTKSFVDPEKIGITGGSYGGYVTCMAMTYGSDYFTHGIANYSVTDWKLYDSVYTERYMDTPSQNPEGYEFGSVMTHADKYKGKMLIVHGTMDDNVHPINTIKLISKLQDLNKDFELMLYPGKRHGWRGPKRDHLNRETVQFWFKNFLNKKLDINKH